MTGLELRCGTGQAGNSFTSPTEQTILSEYKDALKSVVLYRGYEHFDEPIQLASGEVEPSLHRRQAGARSRVAT